MTASTAYDRFRQAVLADIKTRKPPPVGDQATMAVVTDHMNRWQRAASTGTDEVFSDPAAVCARLLRSMNGHGPLDLRLPDRRVREISGNGGAVSCKMVDGTVEVLDEPSSEAEIAAVIRRLVNDADGVLDATHPGVNGINVTLPPPPGSPPGAAGRQARLWACVPPRARHACVFVLRIFEFPHMTLDRLVELGSLSEIGRNLLQVTAMSRCSVLVAGPAGAGKTAVLAAMMRAAGDKRTLVMEQYPELPEPKNGTCLYISAVDTMYDLVLSAKKGSPELIINGELVGEEAWEMTNLAQVGSAFWCAVHSRSAVEALKTLAFAAKSSPKAAGVSVEAIQARFAEMIDLVVYVDIESTYSAQARDADRPLQAVTEIAVQVPQQGGGVVLEPIFTRQDILSPLEWTGTQLPAPLADRLNEVLYPVWRINTRDLLAGVPLNVTSGRRGPRRKAQEGMR